MRFAETVTKALLIAAASLVVACEDPSEGTGIQTGPGTGNGSGTGSEVKIPDYPDDYSAIAGWGDHNKWNLANVHDPSIAWYDGYYYMYCTDASYGNEHLKATTGRHFPGKRSKDLVNWTYVPGPMNDAPTWVKDSLNNIRSRMNLAPIDKPNYGYWAPVIREVNGKLRMYYCIVIDDLIGTGGWGERAFIGMCESSDPANGKWEDKGYVVCSASDKGRDGWKRVNNNWEGYFYYNAIDPTYLVDDPSGKHYLIYGSWHSGFALLEIDPESGKPVNAPLGEPWADSVEDLTARYGIRVGTRTAGSRWQGSEAPEVIYKDGYYYLFMAYDGLDIPYNTRVVRSEKIEGPYYDITGRNFTNGRGDCYPIVTHPYKFSEGYGWVGIAHCCVFQERNGEDWFYSSQGRLPAKVGGNAYSNAIMMGHVRRLVWCPASADEPNNLWPIALPERYAAVPDAEIKKEDLVGRWEHINLAYQYATQQTSKEMVLKADGTMTGALKGTWTYDAAKKWLTFDVDGKKVTVCVEREADWEASPRCATIVYAGTEKSLNATWWGKKVE
ncbi:MAG: arabinan endo-1,5-alpha-L-arabinosidase [Bacteroidales bacterium]|nr:arabinan endo-1,5-alpha-L-arabinosidase [Bacteroidales bacterium]